MIDNDTCPAAYAYVEPGSNDKFAEFDYNTFKSKPGLMQFVRPAFDCEQKLGNYVLVTYLADGLRSRKFYDNANISKNSTKKSKCCQRSPGST